MSSGDNADRFLSGAESDFEELLFMDEYRRSNLREALIQSKVIFNQIENKYPRYAEMLKSGFRAELLVEKGMASTVEEAEEMIHIMRSHRTNLQFCRDVADKYIYQLTDKYIYPCHFQSI